MAGSVVLSTGASLIALTVMEVEAVAVLKAVAPPVPPAMRSAVPPAVPLVWSQAWKVRPLLTVPFQSGSGTKRT